ncbi:hypothetical protein CPB86DRAFT_117853 [Serendipita vermifera]|nr:hypothetical protein CPB86DRAFT_117853 [Serendipita vermifera]
MSALQTIQKPGILINDLPQDTLWVIFDFYAETDGPRDPLEKLLHVCKYWFLSARQHRRLWTKFPIRLSSNKHIEFWLSRTPNRIKFCGEEGPTEVEFSRLPFTQFGSINGEMLSKLSNQLIGHNGSLFNRWSRISVEYIPLSVQEVWNKALSRPTPNLRFLKISDLEPNTPILPFAPSLEELIVIDCTCTLENDFRRLKSLELRGFSLKIQNLSAALTAKNLTMLSLTNCERNITLPSSFPFLEAVSFTARIHASIIEQFSAPRLRSLSIWLRTEESITALKNCLGINFQQLETLGYGCSLYSKTEAVPITQSIKDIFTSAIGIKRLRALNLKGLRSLLLCIQDKLNPTIECHSCSINSRYYGTGNRLVEETFFISTHSTEEDIRRVRRLTKIPLDDTWEGLISSCTKFSSL